VTTDLPAIAHAASTSSNLALLPTPESILHSMGAFALIGVCLIIFAECGLLIGFFLPGDSLLFVAGLFVGTNDIAAPLWLVCVLVSVCAFVGNVTGYWIGRKVGPALFNKPDSKLFKQQHVDKTHEFFEKYGPRAIILARFVPIVRTFITAVAGVGRMDQRKFFTYSAIGAVPWAGGITALGYFLGSIAWIKNNIDVIGVLIVVVSVIPIGVEYLKARREKVRAAAK
jgi:membrane-associated protein